MSYRMINLNRVDWLCAVLLTAALMVSASTLAQVQNPSTSSTYTWQDNPFGTKVTRWVDPDGRRPMTYEQWRQQVGSPERFEAKFISTPSATSGLGRGTRCDIIINASLHAQTGSMLDQYVADLTAEGYDVTIVEISGGTPEELRDLLIDEYALGLEGCVLIGDLPVAWGESECWDEKENEEFPMDLFYMDMDGQFTDADTDGAYDTHTGDVTPEIWLGRLTASRLTMGGATEPSLLDNYFRKNHLYRTGRLPVDSRALMYIDDEWMSDSTLWDSDVSNAYNNRTLVAEPFTTWGPDYTARLPQGYDLIQICSHSSPNLHSFTNPLEEMSFVYTDEIKALDPQAHFYNLYACSNARFTEPNYMGGWYVFCQTYGLAAVGSAKTGAMLQFDDFYVPFGQGKTFGEAFRDWFTAQGSDGFAAWEVCWYYGMTLCGDPTLRKLPVVRAQNSFGPAPLTVGFTSDIGLPITSCSWDFGDGQGSSDQNTSHHYAGPGSYDVGVTLTTTSRAFSVMVPKLVSAYADTLAPESVLGVPGARVSVHVNLHNYLEVGQIVVPFHWSGPLNLKLDSISTSGLRTAYFQRVLSDYRPQEKRGTVTMNCPLAQPYLPPGDSPVLTLWFTIPAAATPGVSPITLTAYSPYAPHLLAYAGGYEPAIAAGSVTYSSSCCVGPTVGNVDSSPDLLITMSDLTVLIDHLFITLTPLACLDAGNIDMSSDDLVTMSDLTVLIDHLFITLAPLPACP